VKENLSCEACERELIALIDGVLTPAVARVIEWHVKSCPRCRAAIGDYRAVAVRLQAMSLLMPPLGLEDRVVRETQGARRFLGAAWQRFGAGLAAASFALTVALLANLPRLTRPLGLPDPSAWALPALDSFIRAATSLSKGIANEVTFYEPIARQVWIAAQSLKSIPRAVLVSLRTPEVQVAGAIVITLGLALYLALRPSRSHERGVGHVCLSL
jgi:anti-sigma factor RsiW